MGNQMNQGPQNPASEPGRKDDQSQRDQKERAGQTPQEKHEKDRESNPSEQRPNQDQQYDPSHTQKK